MKTANYNDSTQFSGIFFMSDKNIFLHKIFYIYKDFNENPYICEYYLNNPEETAKCKELDFLGEGKKKLDKFKEILDRIKEERKNTANGKTTPQKTKSKTKGAKTNGRTR